MIRRRPRSSCTISALLALPVLVLTGPLPGQARAPDPGDAGGAEASPLRARARIGAPDHAPARPATSPGATPDGARPAPPPSRSSAAPSTPSPASPPATPSPSPSAARPHSKSPQGADQKKSEKPEKPGKKAPWWRGFGFGSYGRVGASTNPHGEPGRQLNLVAHGPRLGEGPYVETDLYYNLNPYGNIKLQTVLTLAFTEALFHYSGDFDSMLAIRNLYLEGHDLFVKGLSVWVGSRMYRGDDIYLLDFWPLDNLNTVGGGVRYHWRKLRLGWHIGVNRLKDLYQYQEVLVPGLDNTSETVVLLNRQRLITSLKAEQQIGGAAGHLGGKVKLYGELHAIGSGTLNAQLPAQEQEKLPSDIGYLVGLQAGLWNFGPRSHLNLFVRWAQGLAAYGEFAIPFGLDRDKRAKDAREFLVAFSGNWETKRWFGIQIGGYARYFRDADPNRYDWDDGWEYVAVARPHLFLHRLFALAVELSYQGRVPAGLNPWTHTKLNPGIFKLSVLPLLTFGKGTYARPQLRLIYTLMLQNKGARMAWNPMDPRRSLTVGHYFGIQAEWWFNSTYR